MVGVVVGVDAEEVADQRGGRRRSAGSGAPENLKVAAKGRPAGRCPDGGRFEVVLGSRRDEIVLPPRQVLRRSIERFESGCCRPRG